MLDYFDNAFNLFMQLDSSSPDSLSWCGTEQLGHSAKYWASRLTKITSLLFILICIFQICLICIFQICLISGKKSSGN